MTKEEVLKQSFGYSNFREGQADIIDNILSGRDVLGVMPTGAGKSLCYQIPALMLKGITLVISPLISLMKDQVDALIENGIPAAFLNSTLNFEQMKQVLTNTRAGKYKLLYIAPERLDTAFFYDLAAQIQISLLIVDEAHCISQWGQDFRPSYLKIRTFLENLHTRPVVAALTATATHEVREDICHLLQLHNPYRLTTSFDRKNLYFEVQKPNDKYKVIKEYLNTHPAQSGIIYCSTRKSVEEVSNRLCRDGYRAARYHAGLSEAEREQNQDDFLYDRIQIIVATNAFGMGIDKSNVSFVIHYNMPMNIESYYQEAGRAGRDGTEADCILLYGGQDVVTHQFLIENGEENDDLDPQTAELIKIRSRERLKQMTYYCNTADCLRTYILQYFGEKTEHSCGNCSNCGTYFVELDITEDAQKILSCIKRMNERYGIKMVIDTLRASKAQRILRFQLDKIKTYGIMSSHSEAYIRDVINYLLLHHFLNQTDTEYPVLKLTPNAWPILRGEKQLMMKRIKEPISAPKAILTSVDDLLFTKLKTLRTTLAKAHRVPSYIIFSDAALKDMCQRLPTDTSSFLEVSGVGKMKLERYGKPFIEIIKTHLEEIK